MVFLGFDIGERRMGVAISDPLGIVAQPLQTITIRRGGGREAIVEHIVNLVHERRADGVVLGLPKHMSGELGPEAERVIKLAANLRQHLEVDVELWDERLTSVEANRLLAVAGVPWGRRRAAVDRVAAVLILQGFLDRYGGPDQGQDERASGSDS